MTRHHSPQLLALVDDAMLRIREISAAEVKTKLERGEGLHLLGVRDAEESRATHLPPARHLSKGVPERDIETTVSDFDAEIVLYCSGGYRSALSADNLQKMGIPRVTSLTGGWRAWLDPGCPMSTDDA